MADDTAEGVLAIRPTALRLCAPEADTAHLVGHVADNAFRGRHYELVVDLPAGRRLTAVVAERRVLGGRRSGCNWTPPAPSSSPRRRPGSTSGDQGRGPTQQSAPGPSEAPLHPVMGGLANRHHGPNPSP